MALIECPECGKEVSTTASNCPNCGYNIKRIIQNCVACELNKKKMILMNYDKEQNILICPECGHITKFRTPEEEAQIEQNRRLYEMQNSNKPKCPICGSTNLSKISATQKAMKIATFGIFGMGDNGKTYKCNNCGSKF